MSHATYLGRDATFTVDGVPFPIEEVSTESVVTETEHRFAGGVTTISCTCVIDGDDARSLLDFLRPPIRGATDAVLARRVSYGGRKGRSAMRRLLAKGFVGILRINGFAPMPLPPFRIMTRKAADE